MGGARGAGRTWARASVPWALGLVLLVSPVVAGDAWGLTSGTTPAGPLLVPGPSFASRAGYDPTLAAQVAAIAPDEAPLDLVVSFQPSTPLFYDVPAAGTAAMSPAEVAAAYGLSPSAYAAAEAYFESRGLTVTHAWPDRLSLSLAGPASAVGGAFSTTVLAGTYDGRAVTFPTTPPALPAGLESEVAGVVGLSSGFATFSLPLRTAVTPDPSPQDSGQLITPSIARLIYGASGLYNYTGTPRYATGETIVLLLWGDGYAPSDLATFYANSYPSDFPPVKISAFPVDGAPQPSASATSDPSMAPQELTLDLEWSGSLAPGASLDAVYAPDGPASDQYSPSVSSMTDAFNEAVTGIPGVDAISMSFGTAEGSGGGLEAAWGNDIAEATHEHITLLAATGDNGGDSAYSPCSGTPDPEFPAADPDVLAVGGTDPSLETNALGQVTGLAGESAWAGSGGGYSTEFADPAYQQVGSAAAKVEATGHRGFPDVAAASASDYLYYAGNARNGQGTSFATPMWAGLIAEMDAQAGAPLGFVNGNLYAVGAAEPGGQLPVGLEDITTGANCLGPASAGWDTATGWGSPRAVPLFADLTASIVNVSIATAPDPSPPGGSVTLTARVTNQSSGSAVVGVPVLLTLTADTTIGPCQGSFGAAEPDTNSTGVASATFTVPACYLGTKAVASAQVTGDGLYGAIQEVVAVNLLGYLAFLGPVTGPPYDVALYVVIMGAAVAAGYLLGRGPGLRERTRPARRPPSEPAPAAPGNGPSNPTASTGALVPDSSSSPSPPPVAGPPPPSLGPPEAPPPPGTW